MEYIISVMWHALEYAALILFASAFFRFRYNFLKSGIIALLCISISVIIANSELSSVQHIFPAFLSMLVILVLFKGKWIQRLLIGLIGYILVAIFDALILFGASALLQISVEELVWRKGAYVVLATAGKILAVLLVWFTSKIHPVDRAHTINAKWALLICIFPLASFFMLLALFMICQEDRDLAMPVVLFCVFLGIANVAIIYVIFLIEKDTEVKQRNGVLRQQMELQTASILALEQAYRKQRESSHDFQNHLQTILSLLGQGAYSDTERYVKELSQSQTSRVLIVNSHQPVVDAILNQKYLTARDSQIEMQFRVNDLSHIWLSASELVVLLSNLLDNAIEACRKLPDGRYIDCTLLHQENLFLSIRNTAQPVNITEHGITTTKEPAGEHGYGLAGVCRVLDRRRAEYIYDYKNGWFQFTAEIPDESRTE